MPGDDIGTLASQLATSLRKRFNSLEWVLEIEGMAEVQALTEGAARYTQLVAAKSSSPKLSQEIRSTYDRLVKSCRDLGTRVDARVNSLRTPNQVGIVTGVDRDAATSLAEWGGQLSTFLTTLELNFQSGPGAAGASSGGSGASGASSGGSGSGAAGEEDDAAIALMRKNIDHVVVVMLENRGFDHVLGMLYDTSKGDEPKQQVPADPQLYQQHSTASFEGLAGLKPGAYTNVYDEAGHDVSAGPALGARSPKTPRFNPHEDFVHILAQMYNVDPADMKAPASRDAKIKDAEGYLPPPMTGYVKDYVDSIAHHGGVSNPPDSDIEEIMEMYLPEQLPVLNGLARSFAVSDMWFCSVPSQTNTNRAYYLSGTARGLVTNTFYETGWPKQHADSLPADTLTVFDLMDKSDWMYFWQSKWPPIPKDVQRYNQYLRYMFPNYQSVAYNDNFGKLDDFLQRAEQGKLPKVSVIEPAWGGGDMFRHRYVSPVDLKLRKFSQGNDMHPPSQLTQGEALLREIYEAAFIRGPARNRTMLIITFDENGGTFDHVAPPAAAPIASIEDSPTRHERAPAGYQNPDLDPDTGTQFGFEFDMFGIRVPTIVIAPSVAPGTVFRSSKPGVPLDHTSLISTLLAWRGIPRDNWGVLGSRVARAPIFADVLQSDVARKMEEERDVFGDMPARPADARAVKDGDAVRLRYVGSRWPAPPQTQSYIGAFHQTTRFNQLYPTLGAADKAVALSLRRIGGSAGGALANGTAVTLKSGEDKMNGYDTLGAWPKTSEAYYYTSDPKAVSDNQSWIVELLASRNPGEEIHYGDEVTLTSTAFSPQRLIASEDGQYVTTNDGEWAIWVVEPDQ